MNIEQYLLDRKKEVPHPTLPEPCWIWTLVPHHTGYGKSQVLKEHGLSRMVHRAAYQLWVGTIPKGHGVLHHCDQPLCFNPQHLLAGTHQKNMQDMILKNRHPKIKISIDEKTVLLIYKAKGKYRDIAAEFGVVQQTVSKIKGRKGRYGRILTNSQGSPSPV